MSAGSSVQSLRALARWVWFVIEMLSCDLHTGFNKKKLLFTFYYGHKQWQISKDESFLWHMSTIPRASPMSSISFVLNFRYCNKCNLIKHTHLYLKLTRKLLKDFKITSNVFLVIERNVLITSLLLLRLRLFFLSPENSRKQRYDKMYFWSFRFYLKIKTRLSSYMLSYRHKLM